jgi:hypothetical protein
MKRDKNVLITAQAYHMLINEYHFQPSQLLAKLPKSDIKINSPKTGRFIGVGSTTYMNLLKEYKEEELMLRRDGHILSPETQLPIKVFGKTFNLLLSKYQLNDLLRYPRVTRGKQVEQPTLNNKLMMTNNKLNKPKKLDETLINQLMLIFCQATYQTGFYYSCYFINQGQLIWFTESVEYQNEKEFDYNHVKRNATIKNLDELKQYIMDENAGELKDIKIKYLSIHDIKNTIKIINKKYKVFNQVKDLNKMIKHHLWFESHMRFFNLVTKKLNINESTEDKEAIDNLKVVLTKDVHFYYDTLINYFNKC